VEASDSQSYQHPALAHWLPSSSSGIWRKIMFSKILRADDEDATNATSDRNAAGDGPEMLDKAD
jgi:hypothetical protein